MLKILWFLFWFIIIVTGLTLLVGYFTTEQVTAHCSDGLADCLIQTADFSFWNKMKAGMNCVYTNVICVFKQIGATF